MRNILSIQGIKSRRIFINLAVNSTESGEKHHFLTTLPIPRQKKCVWMKGPTLLYTMSHLLVSHPPPGYASQQRG